MEISIGGWHVSIAKGAQRLIEWSNPRVASRVTIYWHSAPLEIIVGILNLYTALYQSELQHKLAWRVLRISFFDTNPWKTDSVQAHAFTIEWNINWIISQQSGVISLVVFVW